MTEKPWSHMTTEERAETARFYIKEKGWTYSELANYLGVTRNAIAGMCSRNGIKRTTNLNPAPRVRPVNPNNVVPFPVAQRPEEGLADMAKKIRAKRKLNDQSMVIVRMAGRKEDNDNGQFRDFRPLNADIWRPLEKTTPVHFQNTKTLQCRWPVSEDNHWCCGEPVKEGKPYCPTHSAIAFRPAPAITVKKSRKAAR